MALGVLEAKTRSEAVADQLRREVLTGELEGGMRLRQSDIAARLGVSTTPVREAFAVLVKDGLLSGDPHRGVTVVRPSVEDMVENCELRIALESLAAEKAALHASTEDVQALEGLLEAMARLQGSVGEEESYIGLNGQFHRRISAIAARPRLAEMIETLRERAALYIRLYTHTSSSPEATALQHAEIVEAIRRRAPKRAAKATREHLQHNLDFLLSQVAETSARQGVS